MSHSRRISCLLYDAEFMGACCSLMHEWSLAFLGDRFLHLTGTEVFLRTLGFQCKTGSVSGKLLTHFLRGVLALLSGLFESGRLEYKSVSPLLRTEHHKHLALEHKPDPLNLLLPVLYQSLFPINFHLFQRIY